MACDQGMALSPWNILAGRKLHSDTEEECRRQTGEHGHTNISPNWERNETEKAMSRVLENVAEEVGAKHITSVTIVYLMHKTIYVFPIVGGRRVEQLLANIEALNISLTVDMHVNENNSLQHFDPGFPHTMIVSGTWL
ncbi:hypothetical protein BDQ17DRAFT_1319848 [Cyathus striatus]|nr:hypothetical protein BDQ17DRAFT_1319848 [Cyathus striatus]